MKKLGFIFIAISVGIGFISSIYPYSKCFYVLIGLAIAVFVSGIWAFMLHFSPEEPGMPKYDNPPAPPKKSLYDDFGFPDFPTDEPSPAPKKKCVGITPHGRIYRPEFPKDRY
jgi:hypothetical protein